VKSLSSPICASFRQIKASPLKITAKLLRKLTPLPFFQKAQGFLIYPSTGMSDVWLPG
jgi:hypothetical protein